MSTFQDSLAGPYDASSDHRISTSILLLLTAEFFLTTDVLGQIVGPAVFVFPSDARYTALGSAGGGEDESYSYSLNPAYSLNNKYAELRYSFRPLNWIKNANTDLRALSISIPIGQSNSLTFAYDRFQADRSQLYLRDLSSGDYIEPVDGLLTLAWRNNLAQKISVGVSSSYYYLSENASEYALQLGYHEKKAKALVIGIGVVYHPTILDLDQLSSQIFTSASVQNFGTWICYDDGSTLQMPRFLRLGLAIETKVKGREFWQRFSMLLSYQYQTVLNERLDAHRDYWRFGGEIGVDEMLFLRIGVSISPYASFFGNRNQGVATYGLGLRLPVSKIILNTECLDLKFDFAAVPLNLDLYPYIPFLAYDVRYSRSYSLSLLYSFDTR